MVYTENARVIEPQELREMLEEEYHNPTVERLMFIEAKAANGQKKIFPCYVAGYHEETMKGPIASMPEIYFLIYITQAMGNGEFGLIQVSVSSNELLCSKRIWDKPPTKALREGTPWIELNAGVQ